MKLQKNKVSPILGFFISSVLILTALVVSIYLINSINFDKKDDLLDGIWIISISLLVIKAIDFIAMSLIWPKILRTESKLDNELFPIIYRTIKWVILILAAITVASSFGFNINSLVAGLGIGGIAIAIAAQSVFGNFFGAITIFVDNVFDVGDYVKIIEGYATQTEGYIKRIGIRSTKIIGKTGEEVIVPNKAILSAFVVNYKRRTKRNTDWIFYFPVNSKMEIINKAKSIIERELEDEKNSGVDDKYTVISIKETDPDYVKIYAQFIITIKNYRDSLKLRDKIHRNILQKFEENEIYQGKLQ